MSNHSINQYVLPIQTKTYDDNNQGKQLFGNGSPLFPQHDALYPVNTASSLEHLPGPIFSKSSDFGVGASSNHQHHWNKASNSDERFGVQNPLLLLPEAGNYLEYRSAPLQNVITATLPSRNIQWSSSSVPAPHNQLMCREPVGGWQPQQTSLPPLNTVLLPLQNAGYGPVLLPLDRIIPSLQAPIVQQQNSTLPRSAFQPVLDGSLFTGARQASQELHQNVVPSSFHNLTRPSIGRVRVQLSQNLQRSGISDSIPLKTGSKESLRPSDRPVFYAAPMTKHLIHEDHFDGSSSNSYPEIDVNAILLRRAEYALANRRNVKRQRKLEISHNYCHSCNTTTTPEWRRGPDGTRTLCNACGLIYAKLCKRASQGIVVGSLSRFSRNSLGQPPRSLVISSHAMPHADLRTPADELNEATNALSKSTSANQCEIERSEIKE